MTYISRWIPRYGLRSAQLIACLVAALVAVPAESRAQESAGSQARALVLRGATVHTAAGPAVKGATILIRDGRITAVGTDVTVPADAHVIDVTGKQIIPGMLDNHSHIGFDIRDVNEPGLTAFLRAQFIRAQEYRAAWERHESGVGASPPNRVHALDVILDGPPLSVRSRVERVYVGGEEVFVLYAADR